MAEMTETLEAPTTGTASAIKKVGVVGCGLMGRGIAQIAAQCQRSARVHHPGQDSMLRPRVHHSVSRDSQETG